MFLQQRQSEMLDYAYLQRLFEGRSFEGIGKLYKNHPLNQFEKSSSN